MSKKYAASDFAAYSDDFDICANSSPEILERSISIPETDDFPITPIAPPKKTKAAKGRRRSSNINNNEEDVTYEPPPETQKPTTSRARGTRRTRRNNSETLTVSSESLDDPPPSISQPEIRVSPRKRPSNPQKGRARRNYMSEVASKAPLLDLIDLSTTPKPRVISNISLGCSSSDSDDSDVLISKDDEDLNNPEMKIKIKWMGGIESFNLRKFHRFRTIMEALAFREKTEPDCISLNLGEVIINPDDTPDSINYKFIDFLEGRVLKSRLKITKVKDLDTIELKIQSDRFKKPLVMALKKDQIFNVLCIKLSEELKANIKDFKLKFDGEFLNLNETPEQNDFEGGECLDLIFTK